MSTSTIQAAPPADARLAAFIDPKAPEVFHSVANPAEIWRADPFDVETIHADARSVFQRLLVRAAEARSPLAGKVLLLLGEAGSGKTHLMRAFRTHAHTDQLGYCCYMQMTTEVGNYARYMLQNLIDGLEQPYDPNGGTKSGLARLSSGLLDLVPNLTEDERRRFREGEADDPVGLVIEYADRLAACPGFADCDLELIRILLHLQQNDPRVRHRALMWLRCQEMTARDRILLGDAVPRTQDENPAQMLSQFARLVDAVDNVPLVLLIDQLEDMKNQSEPVERFRKVVDAVTALTDVVPTAVVIMACLDDYFTDHEQQLIRAKLDRLKNDPEPIRLAALRTAAEVRAIAGKRVRNLYEALDVEPPADDDPFPYRTEHFKALSNNRTRTVLDNLRRHHTECITAQQWVEPKFGSTPPDQTEPPKPPVIDHGLDQLWNDFHTTHKGIIPDDEGDLAGILADAIRECAGELPDDYHFGQPKPDGRMIEVEIHKPGNVVDKLLVAVCNRKAQGGGLANQINEVEKRAGDTPVALVRTTDFPGPTAQVTKQIGKFLKRDGRRVVVENSEWRRMLAFKDFHAQHHARPGFREWQQTAHPLGELKALQDILRLKTLVTVAPQTPAVPVLPSPPTVTLPPAPTDTPAPVRTALPGQITLGRTVGLAPRPVDVEVDQLKRHAVFLGSPGSGKTTAALFLIEQLLLRGVPVVLVDRKGDLARYADPTAWSAPLPDLVRATDREQLRAALDVQLYTPGEPNGRPLGLPVLPPGFADLSENDRDQYARFAAAALGSMMGFKSSNAADQSQRAILAVAVQLLAESPGTVVTIPALKDLIEGMDDALVARVGGFDGRMYKKLADRLLTLWLNNQGLFAGGETLDVDALLGKGPHAVPGRTRLTVLSTKFLAGPDQVDFWVAQLLTAVGRWCARSPSDRLQAVLLFDEADLYLPATREPATKRPMMDLLKRARSAGVGVFLATQNPGDFDYKGRENVLTTLVGKVSEQRSVEKIKDLFAGVKGDLAGRLAKQSVGEFHLATEGEAVAMKVDPSLVKTDQLPDDRIIELARGGAVRRSSPAGAR